MCNSHYGRRSTIEDLDDEGIPNEIVDLFYRASQMDDEQCVRRLICEVNAAPDKDDGQTKWVSLMMMSHKFHEV